MTSKLQHEHIDLDQAVAKPLRTICHALWSSRPSDLASIQASIVEDGENRGPAVMMTHRARLQAAAEISFL